MLCLKEGSCVGLECIKANLIGICNDPEERKIILYNHISPRCQTLCICLVEARARLHKHVYM